MTFFSGAAAASHAAYAGVHFSEIHYRTQNYSRIWCSIFLALVLAFAARRWPRTRGFAVVIAAAFIGFGVAGGLERQEFFVAAWSHQRKESSRSCGRHRFWHRKACLCSRSHQLPSCWPPKRNTLANLGPHPVSSGVQARGVRLESRPRRALQVRSVRVTVFSPTRGRVRGERILPRHYDPV